MGQRMNDLERSNIPQQSLKSFEDSFVNRAAKSPNWDYIQGDNCGGLQLNPFSGNYDPQTFADADLKINKFCKNDKYYGVSMDQSMARLRWNAIQVCTFSDYDDDVYYNQYFFACFTRYAASNSYLGKMLWVFTYPILDYFISSENINLYFPNLQQIITRTTRRGRENVNLTAIPLRYRNFTNARMSSMRKALNYIAENEFSTIENTNSIYTHLNNPKQLLQYNFSRFGF